MVMGQHYVVQAKDEAVRAESTSGGAFTPLAKAVLSEGGIICGAAYADHTSFHVKHLFVDREEDLKLFRNSKYVQSEMADCLRQCEKYLKQGRKVLFSGTPCQIAGLKNYLTKDYDNLYTVDVVCRAVASPAVFQKYLEWHKKKYPQGIADVRFRDKHYGYNYSTMSVYPIGGGAYHKGIESDLYLRTFFSGICDRPSCSNCKFRCAHMSDLTIWDCFHVRAIAPEMDDNKGTTRLAVNTEKGGYLLNLAADMLRMKRYEPDVSKREVAYSEKVDGKRRDFFEDLHKMEAEAFFNKYFPATLKVKVLGTARLLCYRLGIYKMVKQIWNHYKNKH